MTVHNRLSFKAELTFRVEIQTWKVLNWLIIFEIEFLNPQVMSLELKLSENCYDKSSNENKLQLGVGGDLQGFVCFTWTSPFHKYVDYCNLISKFEGHFRSTVLLPKWINRADSLTVYILCFVCTKQKFRSSWKVTWWLIPTTNLAAVKSFTLPRFSTFEVRRPFPLPHFVFTLATCFGFNLFHSIDRYLWREKTGTSFP